MNIKDIPFIENNVYANEFNLVCPVCKHNYSHLISKESFDNTHRMIFEGEGCRHYYAIDFVSHKGITLVECVVINEEEIKNKKLGRQKMDAITDKNDLKSLAEKYEEKSPAHYLLFCIPISFGIPVNQLIKYTKEKMLYCINSENILSDVFTEEKIIKNFMAATTDKNKDDYVFNFNKKNPNKYISRVTCFNWLRSISPDINSEVLKKTYDYFLPTCPAS